MAARFLRTQEGHRHSARLRVRADRTELDNRAGAAEDWRAGAFVDGAFASGQMTVSAHVEVVFSVD
jgi:hypothetical protein